MNNMEEVIKARHSVREYLDKPIEEDKVNKLNTIIEKCNQIGDLNIKLVLNDSKPFENSVMGYGKIKAFNYLEMSGKKCDLLDEKIGYYGEKIVLYAQSIGLNTCWISGTYDKEYIEDNINNDVKHVCIIAIGYGVNNGHNRLSKTYEDVSETIDAPDWYKKAVSYALLAPTAVNEQKFKFKLIDDNKVKMDYGVGLGNTIIDAGIVKCHFELGAERKIEWIH